MDQNQTKKMEGLSQDYQREVIGNDEEGSLYKTCFEAGYRACFEFYNKQVIIQNRIIKAQQSRIREQDKLTDTYIEALTEMGED